VTPPLAPERARVGATPMVRDRLGLQRRRPLLVRLYAALLGDMGLLGAPARRRLGGALLRAVPGAVALAAGALVARRAFESPVPGWPEAAALAALAVALGAVVWRRTERAAAGASASRREQLELGALFVVAAQAMAQTAGGGGVESPLQPLVYLVMAFLVAFLSRAVGFALVLIAVLLEGLAWQARGASAWELPAAVVHAGFLALFAVLYHAVLAGRVVAARRAERVAVERRMREIDERAREFRLLSPAGAAGAAERERLWTEAAVVEVEAAVRGSLEVAEAALRSHTCAVFLLSDDERELTLRECRSPSGAVRRAPIPAGEGALGGAVKRRSPIRLAGELKVPSYYEDGTRPGALLAVPLLDARGGHLRGVIVADRLEATPFTDSDERLLVALSSEILRAAAAERLMIDTKRSRDEKERFFEALERLNRTSKPAEVFDATLEIARQTLEVDFAAITLVEERDGRRVHRIARVAGAEEARATGPLEGLEFADDTGLVASAVRLGSALPGKEIDVAKTPVFDGGTRLRALASLKVLPLKSAEKTLGALVVGARRAKAYSGLGGEAVRQLEVIAMQAGESILRARLFDETERLATTDGLTGLTNHRTFQARLDEHLAQAQRYGKKTSLLLCDIDHFKSVNDTYGHPAGDQVLRGVARTLAREARATDVVARYGGEEFAVVMPETDAQGALVIAERIREKIAALVFDTDQGPLRVTLSLGVATFPEDGERKADLVERADGCLYHAKRNGRNRSVSAASLRGPRQARASGGAC